MIAINVTIATGPDKVTHIQVALLRHHVGEQGVAGDVEGHTQEDIGAALIELTAEFASFLTISPLSCRWSHVKLKERMAGHQRHFVQFTHIPAAHNDAARVRVGFESFDDFRNLVNMPPIRRRPRTPLHAIDRAQIAIRLGPFIPNRYAALGQPVVVRRAG